MSQLRVEAGGVTAANPDVVWSLVADANSYPQWGPWSDGGYQPPSAGPSRSGAVQWFRYGRRTTTVEEILEVEEAQRLVYTVVRGIPVKHYRAEVTLSPVLPSGTSIRWSATWDKTFMGRMARRKLQRIYQQVVSALVAASDEQAASNPVH